MLDAILPPYFPLSWRMKVIVAGYRENNNYHLQAFVSWIKYCFPPWSSIIQITVSYPWR
jgi:hypothetical protein